MKQKYKTDFQGVYEETYTFRAYGDYRKFPETDKKFDREHLKKAVVRVQDTMNKILGIINQKINISELMRKSMNA